MFPYEAARIVSTLGVHALLLCSLTFAQTSKPDVSTLSLETLSNAEITTVSRKSERLSQTAAAAYVVTQEDIRRSGATNIPEALRMVPGLEVAQIDGNKWAITSRGFNERFSDKALIMIDGRSILTPLSSGVNWDTQDTILEDIERIEVIRGPGASLWGANAVNGVINIITKTAKDTQGGLITVGGGNLEGETVQGRYGGTAGSNGFYRIFAKEINREALSDSFGKSASDNWHVLRGGFRGDWSLSHGDELTVQGDLYSGQEGQSVPGLLTLTPPPGGDYTGTFNTRTNLSGGNVLARWHRASSDRFDTTLQVYGEKEDRSQIAVLSEYRHTFDWELEQHFATGRHDLIWGGDYRYAVDNTTGGLNISFNPANRTTNLFGAFLQDEITLVPDRLRVTLGGKLEHNSYSGYALQPNFRLLLTPRQNATIWLGISGASENSSRVDADIRTNDDAFAGANGVPVVASSFGTVGLPPENVMAYEFGYRQLASEWWSFDLATFYNRYTNRHTQEPAAPFLEDSFGTVHLVLPTLTASNLSGETHGFEFSSTLKPATFWKLTVAYTLFRIHLHALPSSLDLDRATEKEGTDPRQQFKIRLEMNLPHKLEFDTAVYYVGNLESAGVPQYTRVDARLGWRPKDPFELSIGLQNLLDPRHYEFSSGDLAQASQIGRSVYGKATWRF